MKTPRHCLFPKSNTFHVEDFHEFGEIGERARQAVDFVDDDDGDFSGADLLQQHLQGRPLQ